jgi:YesN/AraC family two-component response regulator
MGKAKALLKNGSNLQCKEVAAQVGYSDYVQFSKMFRKHVGISPRDYQGMADKK